jgi:hypothetical protein
MNECLREKARTAAGFEAFNCAAIDSAHALPRGAVVKLQNQNLIPKDLSRSAMAIGKQETE